jgi:mxaK protein
MALNQDMNKKLNIKQLFSVKKLTWAFTFIIIICVMGSLYSYKRMKQIDVFNQSVTDGKTPETDKESFEAKFATALYLAKKERYKESTLLFSALMPKANVAQKSAVQYNLGNIFFLRANQMSGNTASVHQEAEYLMNQAKTAYIASLKLDHTQWDGKHNLDRLLGLIPEIPTPGSGEGDKAGLIMGNIPVGLP